MDIKGKHVLVFGSGISGSAAARLLLQEGARVILYDGNTKLDKEQLLQDITGGRHAENVQVLLGELPDEVLDTLTLVVISPGVPTDLPIVEAMRAKHLPIWGESNLLIHMEKGKFLRLLEQMERRRQRRCSARSSATGIRIHL